MGAFPAIGQGSGAPPLMGPDAWLAEGNPFRSGAVGPAGGLLEMAFLGRNPNFGGAFSLNPPQAIMDATRQQMISDAGARERANRLNLVGRSSVDPSTLGFQSLMSQIAGQSELSRGLGAADLGLRQQQLQNYWDLFNRLIAGQLGVDLTERQGRWQDAAAGSGLGQFLGGLGSLGGALLSPGGYLGPARQARSGG